MNRSYAGIGSRETPTPVCITMVRAAKRLAELGFTLRSGHAPGADQAFEAGAGTAKEIYLPWKGFERSASPLYPPSPAAYALAEQFHPAWYRCKQGARALHARNSHQILGAELDHPVEFVLCWTTNGGPTGGTGQALRIAQHWQIPVFNLYFADALNRLADHLKGVPA